MKILVFILCWLFSLTSFAQTYLGLGSIKSEFLGTEFDRYYESDTHTIKQIKFGYNNKDWVNIFGDVGLGENNEINDFALGLVLADKLIRIEQGEISGRILQEDTDIELGTFESDYTRIDITGASHDGMGGIAGFGIQKYSVPYLFEYNDDGDTIYLQDDDLQITSIGLGVHYDPIYAFLTTGYDLERGSGLTYKNDWYLSSSALALSIAKVETSDAPELAAYGQSNKSKIMFGNQGTYELGWMIGKRTPDFSIAVNVGYHIKANVFMGGDLGKTDADPGSILFKAPITIIHGPAAALSVLF